MAKYRDVFKTEKYMEDATVSILNNIAKGLKRRKQLSIWDPIEPEIETESHVPDTSERNKILTKILSCGNDSSKAQNIKRIRDEEEFASGTAVKRNVDFNRRPPKSFRDEFRSHQNNEETKMEKAISDEYSLHIQQSKAIEGALELNQPKEQMNYENEQDRNSDLDVQNSVSEMLEKTLSPFPVEEKGNPLIEKNDVLLNNSISDANLDIQSMESDTLEVVASQIDEKSDFTAWCKRRHEQFSVSSSKNQQSQRETKVVTFGPEVKKFVEKNNPAPTKNEKTHHAKQYSKSKSEFDISDVMNNKKPNYAKKYSKSQSEVDVSDIENKKMNHAIKYMKGRSVDNLAKTQACINIANESHDKSFEIVVNVGDLSRIKRRFPKLNDVLPDIDATITTVPCCSEAVNIILRYLFHRQNYLTALPNATVAVEVLYASKMWEIDKLYSPFFDIFVHKILPSSNIKFIFSQASHYNLQDVCEACKEINENSASLKSVYKRKQKTCSVSVATYVEPLEFCLPLNAMEHNNFELSFERHLLNTIRFHALSGSFTIIGIHINLNHEHIESVSNCIMLSIEYTCKNVTQELDLGNEIIEKPMRALNVINFKNPLEVNPKDLIEITVEMDVKPFLCSTYPDEILIRKRKKGGEFRLNVFSNFKIPKSSENVFLVGKLLYHVK